MVDVYAGLARSLKTLRWFAIAGQSATILLAVYAVGLPLDEEVLWPAIIFLALFNIWVGRYSPRTHITLTNIVAQLSVDVAVLAWLIGWSGGATNPFTSLFLLPVALVAVALPTRWVVGMALICAFAYGVSAAFGKPLPHIQSVFGTAFDLHLWGMAVNFVISVSVVAFFLTRLARSLRADSIRCTSLACGRTGRKATKNSIPSQPSPIHRRQKSQRPVTIAASSQSRKRTSKPG